MIANEATQDAMNQLKSRVEEQLGLMIQSCVFIVLGTKPGEELRPNGQVITGSIQEIPRVLDNASHDMLIVQQVLEIARTREADRKGFGFTKESPPDQ